MSIRITYLFVFFMISALFTRAQVDTTGVEAIPRDSLGASVQADSVLIDSVAADSVKELFKVVPWKYHKPLNSELVASDSTLRWQLWPSWSYKTNRDPGVISYRLGTIQRTNAFQVHAQEPRYQKLKWEDIDINDPVSGTVNWDFIPLHKVNSFYSEDNGLFYESTFYLKNYYLNKPLTKLNYGESKFDYRSLEFMLSQNFSQKTNVEISFWDRRGGGEYNNSNVSGNQIYGRIFHQLDHRQSLKLKFLNNNYTIGEPFGYNISDLQNFAFNRFATSANESRAESNNKASNLALSYYRREADTAKATDNLHASLFYNNRSRDMKYSADSTFYKVQSFGANARKWFSISPFSLEGGVSYEYFTNKDELISNIDQENWSLFEADGKAILKPFRFIELIGRAAYRNRSDGFDAYRFNAGAKITAGDLMTLEAKASTGTIMPTIQQLYWNSVDFSGDGALVNEEISEAQAGVSIKPFKTLKVGLKGQVKDIDNSIMVGTDSSFANGPTYQSISVTPYLSFNTSLLELNGSATYHQFDNETGSTLLDENERVWLKGSAYIKGYLFDRATFVKVGFAGMLAPNRYKAANYNPVLDYWQPLSNDQLLPTFNRLDLDISARVRSIMIVLRWENILDDVNQLGYFETAGYPMTQRRFIFGLRTFFRN